MEFSQNIQTLNSANLDAKDINLNSKSNTQISSSNLRATNKLNIEAGNDIYVVGANTNESTETKEKSKGFFSKKESHLMAINQKVISSNLNAGDISLKAGGNLALVSSNLNANNINLNADENVIVDANHNVEASQSFTKSSRFSLKPTSLYESNLHLLEKGDKRAVASNLNANENININANNISLKGANLNSQKDINLNADLIDISNTNDESYRNEVSKKSKIGLISIGEHIKNLKADLIQKLNPIKDLKAKTKDTSIKIPVAKAHLENKSSKENWLNANSSNLNANGDINLNAKDDINIVGSNLNANEAINLTSQNSNIKHSTNLYAKDTSSKEATGTLSITAQNEYAQIVPAALALKEAIAQLKRVKKEYDNYKKEKSKLEASLNDIKQRYRNKEVGIDYSDIEEVSEILEEYRDEEKYFKENILLATENVNAKNLALITQMAAALASSGTYGFSVGVRADLATTKQESSLKQTSSNKSSLNAKHININSTKDISITGSDLASKEDMSLNSNNLNINSSQDSLKYKSNTKSLTTGFGFTFYGANSSSLELGTNSLKQSEQSLTNNNSHLYSAKDMNINTANDATIKGANLRADERLNLKVGNNLSLESTRDIKDASSKSKGINLSASYSGATNAKNFASGDRSLSSVGASISKSNSNTKIKQTNLSSITANELNVEVGKNTHLKGSLLAAGEYDKDNTFIDNHNLNLKTNTLSYENLSNTSYNKGSSLSIGANYSVGKKDDSKASQSGQGKSDSSYSGLKSINYSNQRNLSYTLSKNMATLGSGNIEIADKDNSDDLTRLNRDTTKLTKDLVNTSISSNVDASMDLRVLTKSGQKDIAKEIVDANYGLKKLSEQMPDENSKNKIVSIMGKLLVYGSMVALDIIPTSYNNGGLFGQLVGSFGGKEIASDLISVFSKNSEKYELYKDKMVKLEDSKYFKTISPEKREELKKLSYFKDLYVSKEPLGIDVDTITHQNFGNGILNTPMEAIMNGLEQTGQIKKDGTRLAGNTIELTIKYNPTRGFFSDLLEAAQDKFSIGTSDMAKQVGSFISDVTKAAEEKRKKDNKIFAVNFAAHSQLNTLVYNGVKWGIGNELYRHLDGVKSLMKKGKGSPYTVSSFGSPVDVEKMRDVLEAAKIGIAGTFSNKDDFVAEGLGGNKDVNKKADMADRINVLNIPKLFMDGSPHSSYVCQDYEKDGAICGVNFQ